MDPTAKSTRLPWLRGGLVGVVLPLLPLVWVVEVSSCEGRPDEVKDLTGLEVLGHTELEGHLLLGAAVLVMVFAAPLATRLAGLGARVAVHALGLVAAVLALLAIDFAMTFAIFSERTLKPAGLLVTALFIGAVVDALLRVVWSVLEWLAARRRRPAGATSS